MTAPSYTTRDADTVARDLVSDIGQGAAFRFMLGRLLKARSWHRAKRALRMMAVTLRAQPRNLR